jgi:alpha-N-arabinofuranosidase
MQFRQFATFARNYEPQRFQLYLVGCGPNGNDQNWTRGYMDTLANQQRAMHGYSFHFYQNSQLPAHQFTPQAMNQQLNIYPRVEQAIVQQRALLDTYDPGRRIGLFLDEWGVWDRILPEDERSHGRLWMQSTMRSAVAAGLGLNIFNRQADKLYMCNIAQIVNVLQSMLLTDGPEGKTTVRTTTYHAFAMFKAHRGKMSVRSEADGNRMPSLNFGGRGGGGRGGPQQQEAPHDLSVSASREGNEMVITLVNPRHDTDMDVDCALRGVTAKSGRAQILHDSDMNSFNSFDQPDKITVKPHEVGVQGGSLKITLPAMSIATVTLQVG